MSTKDLLDRTGIRNAPITITVRATRDVVIIGGITVVIVTVITVTPSTVVAPPPGVEYDLMAWIGPPNQQVTVGTIPTRISTSLSGGRMIMAQAHAGAGMRSMTMRRMTASVTA